MASRGNALVSIAYIYFILSASPLNAARLKAVNVLASELGESQELMKELQKLAEAHATLEKGSKAASNSSAQYIGETWASCTQREADFERRAKKVQARYDTVKADKDVTINENGWVLLKAYSLVQTYLTAKKQGCDWVHNKDLKSTFPADMLEEMKQHMPCYDDAMAALEGGDKLNQDEAAIKSIKILISDDCKAGYVSSPASTKDLAQAEAFEEKEEHKATEASKQLTELLEKGTNAEAGASLMQASNAFARSAVCRRRSVCKTKVCTGDFYESGRPPPGTRCAGKCISDRGYWGPDYCRTDGKNWGAPCKACAVSPLARIFWFVMFVMFVIFLVVGLISAIFIAGFLLCAVYTGVTLFVEALGGGPPGVASSKQLMSCFLSAR